MTNIHKVRWREEEHGGAGVTTEEETRGRKEMLEGEETLPEIRLCYQN
jgi:hypothetical protein